VTAYQPATDINLITVNGLISKLDKKGSEDFMIDMEGDFREHWDALVSSRMSMYDTEGDQLIKDL
jgi:membrane protein